MLYNEIYPRIDKLLRAFHQGDDPITGNGGQGIEANELKQLFEQEVNSLRGRIEVALEDYERVYTTNLAQLGEDANPTKSALADLELTKQASKTLECFEKFKLPTL